MSVHHAASKNAFQNQIMTFQKLLKGAKMARLSSLVLIVLSLVLVVKSRDNTINIMLLLMGILAIVFFIDKFLSTKSLVQASYTQVSLLESIAKLKTYMTNRKQYEMYFIVFWILTLIPSAANYFDSNIEGVIAVLFYIAVVFVFGNLAYKKSDQQIEALKQSVEAHIGFFN